MRPIFIPLSGKTDGSGNATLPIRLEATGDWRNVKLALGTTAPAEWAVLKTGTPITYGRGRRVTLGPELLEPSDTIVVNVIGGPPNAPIEGSVSGLGGAWNEIMPSFAPQPNTISLDTGSPQEEIPGSPFTIPNDGFAHALGTFQVPSGAHGVGFTFPVPANIAQLQVVGANSGVDYAANSLAGVTETVTVKLYSGIDTAITVTVTTINTGGNSTVYGVFILDTLVVTIDTDEPGRVVLVTNLGKVYSQDTASTGQISLAVSERYANPAPWQAPNISNGYSTGSLAAGGTIVIVAGGGANVRTRLFKVTVNVSGFANGFGSIECPSGTERAQWNGLQSNTQEYSFEGLDCGLNAGVLIRNKAGGASSFIQGHASVNQT
jgi:hypothetical protein